MVVLLICPTTLGLLDEDNQTLRYSLGFATRGVSRRRVFKTAWRYLVRMLYFKASSPPDYEDSAQRSGQVMVGSPRMGCPEFMYFLMS